MSESAERRDYGRTDEGDIDPNRIAHDIDTWGTRWATRKRDADALESTTKAYLAELTNGFRRDNAAFSRREAEDYALASQQYRAHLYAVADARYEANLARVKFDAARARFEALRSFEATRRTEMTTLHRRS